jgi:hypothetical protein
LYTIIQNNRPTPEALERLREGTDSKGQEKIKEKGAESMDVHDGGLYEKISGTYQGGAAVSEGRAV